MSTGMPIAFCFLLLNVAGALFFFGPGALETLVDSMFSGVASFALLPLPLFILMGTVIFESGVGLDIVDVLDKWLGRMPGRLSLLAVGAGAILASLTGVSTGSVAMLGKGLLPEMERRGYQKPMTFGPILGGGGLATMIPPSALGVFLAAIGQISIGKLLIAIIIPGLLMAVLYAMYIIVRCMLQPSLAPLYTTPHVPLSKKLISIVWILPIGIVIFAVIGVIYLGIATPSEAAAVGVLSCYVLAAVHGKLNWQLVKRSTVSALHTNIMILMIIAAAISFSKILAFSGATRGMVEFAMGLSVSPMLIIVASQVVVLFMGMFMGPNSIIMITLPIYMPMVLALGFDTVWFGVIMLINVQLGLISPPFGMDVYVLKGIATGATTEDVFRYGLPFLWLGLLAMAIIMVFPEIALWLPAMMR
jgi:tripartite ATP-independent transporter DctM subunit